jgi:hypothetical protein
MIIIAPIITTNAPTFPAIIAKTIRTIAYTTRLMLLANRKSIVSHKIIPAKTIARIAGR